VSGGPKQFGEHRDVRGSLGQNQAVPFAGERGQDVGEHLLIPGVVSDKVAIDRRDPTRSRRIGLAAIDEVGQVDGEGPQPMTDRA
jgi:hypothetical protein